MARHHAWDRRAIITGASSGIGSALATELASRGAGMVLVARRAEKLRALASDIESRILRGSGNSDTSRHPVAVPLVVGDITDPQTRATVIDTARERLGGIDILINNAGTSAHGRFVEYGEHVLRRIMEVNFFAAAELTRAAVPLLKEGRNPVVVNIGSILGRRGVPRNSAYCASKFALSGWSEAIRPELAQFGIQILLVQPGTTATEFFEHLLEKHGDTPWPKQRGIPAEQVARAVVRAIERGQHEIIPHRKGRLLIWLNRLSPRLVDRIMKQFG